MLNSATFQAEAGDGATELHEYNSYLNLYLEEICILFSSSVLTGVFQDIENQVSNVSPLL